MFSFSIEKKPITGFLYLNDPTTIVFGQSSRWWREKDLNLRPPGYGPGKLPLLYPAMTINKLFVFSFLPRAHL